MSNKKELEREGSTVMDYAFQFAEWAEVAKLCAFLVAGYAIGRCVEHEHWRRWMRRGWTP
jgi:hypothetical protein